ncbi:MAG: hypothetical protein JST92_02070, partial [Deltaproteobacteria bacterium]|nr:hypothetical protein [Deltaproteobacteria bacterium]
EVVSASADIALVDDGAGPALVSLIAPDSVPSGALVEASAQAASVARVASIEYALDGTVVALSSAPALAASFTAPTASIDTQVTLTATALDAQGRRGASISRTLTVSADAVSAPALALHRVGTGPIFEGSVVSVQADVSSTDAVAEVRFSIDGTWSETLSLAPYVAALTLPISTGAHTVHIGALAIDVHGRVSALADLPLVVVDDLTLPAITLTLDPTGPSIGAGSLVRAQAHATDNVSIATLTLSATLGAAPLATGGSTLTVVVPANTPAGTTLTFTATALDPAGNTQTAHASLRIDAADAPGDAGTAAGAFAQATALAVQGDLVAALTPSGLVLGTLTRGATPSLTLESTTPSDAVALALQGTLLVLARGAAGVDVLDVSDPSSPALISHLADTATTVVAGGGRVYLSELRSDGAEDTRELIVPDPRAPYTVEVQLYAHALAADADGPILAGSGPYAPYVMIATASSYNFYNRPDGAVFAGAHTGPLSFFGTDAGLDVYLYGTRESLLPLPSSTRALALGDGLVLAAGDDGVVRTIDFNDPRVPRVVASEALDTHALALSGGVLLAATDAGLVLRSVNTGAGEGPALGTLAFTDVPKALAPALAGAVVGASSEGLVFVDASDPAGPVQRAAPILGGGNVKDLALGPDGVYFQSGNTLSYASFSDTGALGAQSSSEAHVHALSLLGPIDRFALSPTRVWAAGGGRVQTLAFSGLVQSDALVLNSSALDLAAAANTAVLALGQAGFAVLGLDPFGTPALLSQVSTTQASAVAVAGPRAVIANGTSLSVFDLSSPAAPALVFQASAAGQVRRLRLVGQLLLASEGPSGVELWDIGGAQGRLLATIQAGRADDAAIAGSALLVADELNGVTSWPLPAVLAAPAIEIVSPLAGAEVKPGTALNIGGVASGLAVDSFELVVDGHTVAGLPARDPRARFLVPAQLSAGTSLRLQLRARSAAGSTLSLPVDVRVGDATPAPLSIADSLFNGSYSSGSVFGVNVNVSGGLAPYAGTVRFESALLSSLSPVLGSPSVLSGDLRIPAVSSVTSGSLIVEVTDSTGALATLTHAIFIQPQSPPSFPSGLPVKLRIAPFVNHLQISGTSCAALRVEADGVLVGSSESGGYSSNLTVITQLVLPAERLGDTVTLTATCAAPDGSTQVTSRDYTVLGVTDPPVLQALWFDTPYEGTTINVYARAIKGEDQDVAVFTLQGDGVELPVTVTHSTNGDVNDPITTFNATGRFSVPLLSTGATKVDFSASVADSLGRGASTTSNALIIQSDPPGMYFSAPNLVTGDTASICVTGYTQSGRLMSSLTFDLDGAPVDGTPAACSPGQTNCLLFCANVLIADHAIVAHAVATDDIGRAREISQTLDVFPHTAPLVSIYPADGQTIQGGRAQYVYVSTSSYLPIQSVTLFLDEVQVASGTYDASYTFTPARTAGQRVLRAVAVDKLGATGESTSTLIVRPDGPPTISITHADYLIANQQSRNLTAQATDDVALVSGTLTADGVQVASFSVPPSNGYTSASMTGVYTPPAETTAHFVATALDDSGQSAMTTLDLPVFPAGTGLTCAAAVPMRAPVAGVDYGEYQLISGAVSQARCDGSTETQGTYLTLPFDGPVDQVTLNVYQGRGVLLANGCSSAPSQCDTYPYAYYTHGWSLTNVPKDATLFISGSNQSIYMYSAQLGDGALCDPASDQFRCSSQLCTQADDGKNRCRHNDCLNAAQYLSGFYLDGSSYPYRNEGQTVSADVYGYLNDPSRILGFNVSMGGVDFPGTAYTGGNYVSFHAPVTLPRFADGSPVTLTATMHTTCGDATTTFTVNLLETQPPVVYLNGQTNGAVIGDVPTYCAYAYANAGNGSGPDIRDLTASVNGNAVEGPAQQCGTGCRYLCAGTLVGSEGLQWDVSATDVFDRTTTFSTFIPANDNVPPVPSLLLNSAPIEDGQQVQGGMTYTIEADIDDLNPSEIEVLVDGESVLDDGGQSYGVTFDWRVPGAAGPHVITARATDTLGLMGETSVTVNALQDQPPVGSIDPVSYLVANTTNLLSSHWSDDVAVYSQQWEAFASTDTYAGSSYGSTWYFYPDPSQVGQSLTLRYTVSDSANQTGTDQVSLQVLPEGTGFNCTLPLALPLVGNAHHPVQPQDNGDGGEFRAAGTHGFDEKSADVNPLHEILPGGVPAVEHAQAQARPSAQLSPTHARRFDEGGGVDAGTPDDGGTDGGAGAPPDDGELVTVLMSGDLYPYPQWCDQSSVYGGVWATLPFDQDTPSVTLDIENARVAVATSCGDALTQCDGYDADFTRHETTLTNVPAGAELLFNTNGTYGLPKGAVRIVSARLGWRAKCDPQSTDFVCDVGQCIPDSVDGTNRCLTACSDGVDNDGDGKIDYPNDPACPSPQSDSEAKGDGWVMPACSDGVDNDGDGLVDFPADPSCVSAAGESEDTPGETCAAPFVITDTNVVGVPLSQANHDLAIAARCDVVPSASAPELVTELTVPQETDVLITLPDFSTASVRTSCADDASAVACLNGTATVHLAAGTYSIVVADTDGSRVDTSFNLTVPVGAACTLGDPVLPCQEGSVCAGGVCRLPPSGEPTIPSVPYDTYGYTYGTPNGYAGSCGGEAARDQAYFFVAPADGTYTIDLGGSAFDTVLYVREYGTGAELACSDDACPNNTSLVSVPLVRGQAIEVIVDGFGNTSGYYQLHVRAGVSGCNQ